MRQNQKIMTYSSNVPGKVPSVSLGVLVGAAVGLGLYFVHGTKTGQKVWNKAQELRLKEQDNEVSLESKINAWRAKIARWQAQIQKYIGDEKELKTKTKVILKKSKKRYFTSKK